MNNARIHVTVSESMKNDFKSAAEYWNSSMSREFRAFAAKFIAETKKVKAAKKGKKIKRVSISKARIAELKEKPSKDEKPEL